MFTDLRPATLLKITPTQVFTCEFHEIFKNTYLEEHLWTAASTSETNASVVNRLNLLEMSNNKKNDKDWR